MADEPGPDPKLVDFSDANPVGELMFVPDNGGESVPAPRELPVPPPPPLPPPPPWEGLDEAVFEARCEDTGRVLALGDVRNWPGCEDDCWEPACKRLQGEVVEEPEDGLRLPLSRLEEVKTEENVVPSGEAGWFCGPGLLDAVARRNDGPSAELEVRLVDRGARPRREGGCRDDRPHAVGCARAALEAEVFSEPDAVKG